MYDKWAGRVLEECSAVLHGVDPEKANRYISMLASADRVFFVGVGRVMLMLKCMAKRYSHLGIPCAVVGETTEPAITSKDVIVVGSGSGATLLPKEIAIKAKSFGAAVVHIGCVEDNPIKGCTDLFIRLPAAGKSKQADAVASRQPMTSLFEQSLLLFGDITACMIAEQNNLDIDSLWQYHANLE